MDINEEFMNKFVAEIDKILTIRLMEYEKFLAEGIGLIRKDILKYSKKSLS